MYCNAFNFFAFPFPYFREYMYTYLNLGTCSSCFTDFGVRYGLKRDKLMNQTESLFFFIEFIGHVDRDTHKTVKLDATVWRTTF